MTGNKESIQCQNNSESKQSIKDIVGGILKQAKNALPPDRYKKFEDEVKQVHQAFLTKKKAVINDCLYDTTELKENLTNKLKIQEDEMRKKEIMEAKESCFRNNFNAENINGKKTAKYFEYLVTHQEEINELINKFNKKPELLAGFLHYWKIQHIT
jgi:hypothetical protein